MDVFKPFLQRLSQPIILSFCIAWIFWNWEIVLALCWYDSDSIIKLGKVNHEEYINEKKNDWRNYWWPLIIAGCYPIGILLLNNIHTFFKKYEQKIFFWISKDANVPTKYYLDAKDDIAEQEKRISKFIDQENNMRKEINDLTQKSNELELANTTISAELSNATAAFKSCEAKLEEIESDHNNNLKRASHMFLEGRYIFTLNDMNNNAGPYTVIEGTMLYKKNENENKASIVLKINSYIIESSVNHYTYDILAEVFTLDLTRVSSNTKAEFDHIIDIIANNFMNSVIRLQAFEGNSSHLISDLDKYFVDIRKLEDEGAD